MIKAITLYLVGTAICWFALYLVADAIGWEFDQTYAICVTALTGYKVARMFSQAKTAFVQLCVLIGGSVGIATAVVPVIVIQGAAGCIASYAIATALYIRNLRQQYNIQGE